MPKSENIIAALAKLKSQGIALGNPNLDAVRNSDLTNANKVRLNNADDFALEIIKEVINLGIDNIGDSQIMVNVLNENNILARRGGRWTRTQYNRMLERILNIENSEQIIKSMLEKQNPTNEIENDEPIVFEYRLF